MALSAFDDKARQPRAEQLATVLGRAGARWQELVDHLAAEHSPMDADWTFAGARWGWSLRLRRKRRAILYLTPRDRHFLVGFALGERAVTAAREAGLPEPLLGLIEDAPRYAEGRAVRLEVRTKRDVEAVKRLAAVKMAN